MKFCWRRASIITNRRKAWLYKVDKARIYVDFNEMVDHNTVLLSEDDSKIDSQGNVITFYEGMPVSIYSDDVSDNGQEDNLIADGTATKKNLSKDPYWQKIKWCCQINSDGIKHESDLRKETN